MAVESERQGGFVDCVVDLVSASGVVDYYYQPKQERFQQKKSRAQGARPRAKEG